MTDRNADISKRLSERLLKDQQRRAERERKLPYAEKLRILDRMQADARRAAENRSKPEALGVEPRELMEPVEGAG